MGCSQSQEQFEGKKKSDEIESLLYKEKKSLAKEVKMLLLGSVSLNKGAGESGKSTILKQMTLIHGHGYSDRDKAYYRNIVFSNTINGMKSILEAMERLGISFENPENASFKSVIMKNSSKLSEVTFTRSEASAIARLWRDRGVQQCFARSAEFQNLDSAK
jgi:guanine nucleotide-binding protein G(i) subunit alpha